MGITAGVSSGGARPRRQLYAMVLLHELALREITGQRESYVPHTTAVQLLLPQVLQKKIEYFS